MTMHLERGLNLLNTKIRKKKPKPLHTYEAGFREHNKFLKKMKLAKMTFEEYVDYVQGKWKPIQQTQQKISSINPTTTEPMTRQTLPQPKLSNTIGSGGTRNWKEIRERLEVSKQYSIAPAYNKGPYMVVAKEDLKTAGRKV